MHRIALNEHLLKVVDELTAGVVVEPRMRHLNQVVLPNRDRIVEAIEMLRQLLFPGYFGKQGLTHQNVKFRIGELVLDLSDVLYEQVRCCLRYRENISGPNGGDAKCEACDQEAGQIVATFFDRLSVVREMLTDDVQAAFDGDPAAKNVDETIFCYPGLLAISVQRMAHELHNQNVPLLPRIMTEYAHGKTGIDIHPGAKLGRRFFIDHGTGVVIGETTEIGDNVKVYQGVTLGALAPAYGQMLRGEKRHPTIEDDVVIYAGATILGGNTVIGRGSVIGGNVFITESVPPNNQVTQEPGRLKYRQRGRKSKPVVIDFQI